MVDINALKAKNLQRWQACVPSQSLIPTLDAVAKRLVGNKNRYVSVDIKTGVPWAIIAVIHERESSQSWVASLAQGDPINKPSIHVPAGRGPFASWEEAAIDALVDCAPHLARWEDWSIGGALTALESYNGVGYALHGLPSPYVWASTNQYSRGKYIADGHFDPNAIDHQLGCAGLLLRMIVQDPSISGGWHP
jgi:lysozyme family protein